MRYEGLYKEVIYSQASIVVSTASYESASVGSNLGLDTANPALQPPFPAGRSRSIRLDLGKPWVTRMLHVCAFVLEQCVLTHHTLKASGMEMSTKATRRFNICLQL